MVQQTTAHSYQRSYHGRPIESSSQPFQYWCLEPNNRGVPLATGVRKGVTRDHGLVRGHNEVHGLTQARLTGRTRNRLDTCKVPTYDLVCAAARVGQRFWVTRFTKKLTFEVRQSCGIRRPPNLHARLQHTMDHWLSHVTFAVPIPARSNGTPPLRAVS